MLKIKNRITSRAKRELNKVAKYLRFHGYHNLQVLRKSFKRTHKPEHIILCGPDFKGSSILHHVIRNCTSSKSYSSKKNISALDTLNLFKKSIVTYEPMDLYSVDQIQDLLSDFRNLKFIVVVKDPRSLLTEVHNDIPWQYYQSWDFGFYTSPHPSFTRPGVGKAFDEIEKLKEADDIQFKIIRYEDFIAKPDEIQAEISSFADVEFENSFSEYLSNTDKFNKTNSGISQTNVEQTNDSWNNNKHADRLEALYQQFPEIQYRIKEYDYPVDEKVSVTSHEDVHANKGTVVGMFTPDETYRNEAKRMQASLDRLGIQHTVDELPPVEEIALLDNPEEYPAWFVQKLARYYKPTWLRQKREQLEGPILYCDVDAFFHKNPWPYLSLYDGDIAVFTRRNGVLNSATIWINNTVNALEILKIWEKRCQQKRKQIFELWPNVAPSASDQVILKEIIQENNNDHQFNIQRLPPTMVHIFDEKSKYTSEGIFIEQLQASRVAKSKHKRTKTKEIPTSRDNRISELEGILLDD